MQLGELTALISESFTPELLWTFTAVSCALGLTSLAVTPLLIGRLPADYFIREATHPWYHKHGRERLRAIAWHVARNMAGGVLLVLGVAMLFLPGQGLLTILIALILLEFPAKKQLERSLASRASVRQALDWIRRRQGREPLKF